MTTTVDGVDAFHKLVGDQLGYSEWQPITQERVNLFAEATDDHQWIHVDPERAKDGPFGVAIAMSNSRGIVSSIRLTGWITSGAFLIAL